MTIRTSSLIVLATSVSLCVASAALGATHGALAGRELVVIVHTASPAAKLTAAEVKDYYLKKQGAWSDGSKVRPVQQSGEIRDSFVKRTLGMSINDFERYWLQLKYSAAESPPKQVDTDDDVVRFVGAMKGAIGFVDATSLTPGALAKVKVVLRTNY
jgi:ABC-type phosphate transport system substrate-binding protein